MTMPRRFATWLAIFTSLTVTSSLAAAEWKPLFNGTSLEGWKPAAGPADVWAAEDGLLVCKGGGGGWLSTTSEYSNFELELEFRCPPDGNSGVFLRSPHEGDAAYTGMEIQVIDDNGPEYKGKLQPWQYCGSLYDVSAAKTGAFTKAGEWQKYQILCDGRHVKITLNGQVVNDVNLDDYKEKEAKHPGIRRTTGYVGLQNHGSRMEFRNLRIKELP